jgi:type I restriction enzyme S subunit
MLKFKWESTFSETEIGSIPGEWKLERLSGMASISTGGTPSTKVDRYWNGSINWLRSQEVNDNYVYDTEKKITEEARSNSNAKRIYPPETLIISLYAAPTAGRVAILKTSSTINQALAALESNCNKFLFYSLIGNRERLLLYASGAAQQNLNLELIKSFEIPCPQKLSEQSCVAAVLSWFDDLIQNRKKQNEVLEKTAMAIFKRWFVDFEPFEHTEMGEVPRGWKIDHATEFIEFDPTVKLERNQVYPFLEMKNVAANTMVCEYSSKEFQGSGVRFQGGDTLLARITPCLENGKTAFVWFLTKNQSGFGTTEFIVMRGREESLTELVYLLARTESFREHAINSMSGSSGRQRVARKALETFKMCIPPQPIVQQFHSLVEPLFKKIISNQKQILILGRIRDTLLPLLVFGKLRVEEI